MALEGLHHVTAITADAQRNVDFYAGTLGLRLVKKTVNFDAPDVYHLYFGDDVGSPGSILTFFEFPGAAPGRAGAGDVHAVVWRVGSDAALAFWAERLSTTVEEGAVRFTDPEGLAHELIADPTQDAPLRAASSDVPAEHALLGFAGVRAYAADPADSAPVLDALGFAPAGDDDGRQRELRGDERGALYRLDPPPDAGARGRQGAGSVHHVAWSAADDSELEVLRASVARAGAHPTPIIDRQYFHSVYFREPSGVLFELATRDIGFDVDEPRESLGEALKLPPQHEPLRDHLERTLRPLTLPARS